MKIINNLIKLFLLGLSVSLVLFLLSSNIFSLSICECGDPSTEDTLFYKIEKKSINTWDVLFKNVNVKYKITSLQDLHSYNYDKFHFRIINPNASTGNEERLLYSHNIKHAVMIHFNDIQRGHFHLNLPNHINPNSHGKGDVDSGPISYKGNGGNGGVGGASDWSTRSPLDQFIIRAYLTIQATILGNIRLSLTNMGLYLFISSFLASFINIIVINFNKTIAHIWSICQECIYATVHSIVINQINDSKGQSYYPFMFCLFIIILSSNLIGMIPYSFASTSHFILAFFLSFSIVLGSTILGFFLHKLTFFSLFVPSGCPLGLLPLLTLIEFISFLARNVSLGLRLAANILSGHMLLNILSEFTYKIMQSNFFYFLLGLIPLIFIMAFSALELGIAFIQSQVFVVLSSSYIKDALMLH